MGRSESIETQPDSNPFFNNVCRQEIYNTSPGPIQLDLPVPFPLPIK